MILILKLTAAALLMYISILGLYYFYQDSMIFFPDQRKFGDCPMMAALGASATSEKGDTGELRYYLKSSQNPEHWLLFFHGNGGGACDRYFYLEGLGSLHSNFVVAEYPGYSQSNESPSQQRFLEYSLDLFDHVKSIQDLPVYIHGESMGSGVATYLASQRQVEGLIVHAGFTSITEVAKHHFPYFPIGLMLKHPFPADEWASKVTCPVLAFHGTADETIPFAIGRRQFANFSSPKEFIKVRGSGHNDLTTISGQNYWQRIRAFLRAK